METNLCRICGNLGQNFPHIFNTEGLKIKIETCLPIIVSQYCLLPDTICTECVKQVDNYHAFIKKSLQHIIILESQFSIQESCLKSKQKREKCCYTDFDHKKADKGIQTEEYLHVISGLTSNLEGYCSTFPKTSKFLADLHQTAKDTRNIVGYDVDSDDSENLSESNGQVMFPNTINFLSDTKSTFETEIFENETTASVQCGLEGIKVYLPKIGEIVSSKRKSKVPKKIYSHSAEAGRGTEDVVIEENEEPFVNIEPKANQERNKNDEVNQAEKVSTLPQNCDTHFSDAFATHVSEAHGVELAEVVSSESEESLRDKPKKKLPNLVKISDLKRTDSYDSDNSPSGQNEEPPRLLPSFVCSNCPGEFTNKSDLLMHSQLKHFRQAAHMCGLCTQQCTSLVNLKKHLQLCFPKQKVINKFVCQICQYGDDNIKSLENHVLVHDFLLDECRRQSKIFDPANYIDTNDNFEAGNNSSNTNTLQCAQCGLSTFESFKELSKHKMTQHSIYHCDLCNKFYGRNSHLWKHVNRFHKGHPSITCQLCFQTSASKYYLAQHFSKTHMVRCGKQTSEDVVTEQLPLVNYRSLIQQESLKNTNAGESDLEETVLPIPPIKLEIKQEVLDAPKEIDSSHNLYNNIITNYTPRLNDGEFKCLKCSKSFHKKVLLKKHNRNCRPKMQKDLLTRCKSCSRVFKDRQSLAKHLINYHSDYICELCNQKVQSKCEIVSHIRFQHPECDLVCRICKNIVRNREDMQEHLRNHLESHICQFCGDSLPNNIKLKMHILSVHRKILSLSCGICLKLFENQHVLKDHVTLLHKDQLAPFISCPVCGKNYGSKWKTYDHINKSHGKTFRACRVCLEIFNNDAQLQAHCDVTSHGPSSGFNTTVLKDTIMAMVKSVVTQNIESNNGNVESEEKEMKKNSSSSNNDLENMKRLMFPDVKMSLLEKRLLGKRPREENPEVQSTQHDFHEVNKKLKTELPVSGESGSPQVASSKRTVYINGNDPSYCEICFKSWPAKKHLWQHYIRCHKAVAATVCGICLKTNEDYKALQKHLLENHSKLLHGQGFGSNFICKICGRYHNASSKLRLHMVIHSNSDDWSSTENKLTILGEDKSHSASINSAQEEVINYESLIEQVEYSSNSEEFAEDRNTSSEEVYDVSGVSFVFDDSQM